MKTTYVAILSLVLGSTLLAADEKPAAKGGAVNPVAGMLSKAQMQEGWIALFDGQTPFGWKVEGDSKVADGALVLGGEKATTAKTTTKFGNCEVKAEFAGDLSGVEVFVNGKAMPAKAKFEDKASDAAKVSAIVIKVPAGKTVRVTKLVLKPEGLKPIFNGKDLTGWKPVEGHKSVFTVENGEIKIKDGSGDLQSEWQGQDFVLQLEGISNGKNLNSGVFFRALPGEFWQGYEAQMRNEWDGYSKDEKRNALSEDRTKPVDFGTGALYARQPTRKVVSSDHEWLTMTVIADGAHIATWVNGYQCTDYVDDQQDASSARKGRFLGKGCISLQGHDPTTDLSFKNIRAAELPTKGEKGESK